MIDIDITGSNENDDIPEIYQSIAEEFRKARVECLEFSNRIGYVIREGAALQRIELDEIILALKINILAIENLVMLKKSKESG